MIARHSRMLLILSLMAAASIALGRYDPQDPQSFNHGRITVGASAASVTGGDTVDLTISVPDPVDNDTTVSLSSSPTSAFADLPSSVVIPAGYSYVVITVTTATVSTTVNATVTGAVAALRCRDGKAPPLWLMVAAYLVPALVILPNGYGELDGRTASLVCALCTGVLAARIAGRSIGAVVSLVATVAAAYAIVGYRTHVGVLVSGHTLRTGGLFHDPNQLYVLLLTALPLGVAGALSSTRPAGAALHLLSVATEFAALVLAWFRAAALGLAVAVPAFVWMRLRSRRATALSLVACIVLFGVTASVRSGDRVSKASVGRSNTSRVSQMRGAWRAFLGAPLGGVGIGGLAIPVVDTRGGTVIHVNTTVAKNVVVQCLSERGLAGGLLLGLLVWSISTALRPALSDPLSVGCVAAWLALLGAGMVDSTFGEAGRYAGNCCVGILLGLTATLASRTSAGAEREPGDGNSGAKVETVAGEAGM